MDIICGLSDQMQREQDLSGRKEKNIDKEKKKLLEIMSKILQDPTSKPELVDSVATFLVEMLQNESEEGKHNVEKIFKSTILSQEVSMLHKINEKTLKNLFHSSPSLLYLLASAIRDPSTPVEHRQRLEALLSSDPVLDFEIQHVPFS